MALTEAQRAVLQSVIDADGRRWRPHKTQASMARNLSRKGLLNTTGADHTGRFTYVITDAGRAALNLKGA